MYNQVDAKGENFVELVKDYWDAREQAGRVTALQKQA